MPKSHNGTTYSFDVCSQCKSSCCQDAKPPLTSNRKKTIKDYLVGQKVTMEHPFTTEKYSYPSVDDGVYCSLFNKQTGKCSVHPVKPETCVAGPITFDINLNTAKVEWFLKKSEICAYAGVLFNDKKAFGKHFDVAKKQILQLIVQLNSDELRAIIQIPEPCTFKIGEDNLPREVVVKLGLKEAGVP